MAHLAPARAEARTTRLTEGLERLGLVIPESQRGQLLAYLDGLAKWNAVYNLTAVRDVDDMLAVHLLDSLAIVPSIDRWAPATVLDVGSGAGLPGIPLAIVRPAIRVTTVDAVAKKVSFQQQMKGALDLHNVTAIHARVEALTFVERPALVISRAYSAIDEMLASISGAVTKETIVVAMKGTRPLAELARLPDDWQVLAIDELDVPFLGARRCAVVLRQRERA